MELHSHGPSGSVGTPASGFITLGQTVSKRSDLARISSTCWGTPGLVVRGPCSGSAAELCLRAACDL